MGEPISVAVANDYELVIAGLAAMLQPYAEQVNVKDAVLVGATITDPIDIVLFDTFGRLDGTPMGVKVLLDDDNVDRVVVYTSTPRPAQTAAVLEAGASGVLSKARTAASVVDAIRRIHAGERIVDDAGGGQQAPWPGVSLGLTARQSEVVALLLQGMSNNEIAEALVIDVNTVKTHLRHIYRVLGARSRAQVLARLLPGTEFTRR